MKGKTDVTEVEKTLARLGLRFTLWWEGSGSIGRVTKGPSNYSITPVSQSFPPRICRSVIGRPGMTGQTLT